MHKKCLEKNRIHSPLMPLASQVPADQVSMDSERLPLKAPSGANLDLMYLCVPGSCLAMICKPIFTPLYIRTEKENY